ncbi:Nucleoside-diphosphate-sugar epimerase [Glycomyces sambucus]|uniref:Nucleoside-diphosphate-sugar epimerase n=1 Tax=Glycomyces sambucus TaxID=380244 RepID=A0A1G9H0R7_9ACTN|nr:NAD(P)-dependent oxidoreductase [Glycomyces sambucus]SDL06538.1 Nucleoside-diphosphate-sugar epimerase [Glycomyces sambucus]
MKVVVIGGSGHIGTYLVPRLVRAGHQVVNISRGTRTAYADAPEWREVEQVAADRERQDAEGVFGDTVADLRPDAVVDLVCFTLDSATALVERLRGATGHLLHCGTVWRYGPSRKSPIAEGEGTAPFGEYGIEKDRIARMLKAETEGGGLATTSLHPGHIVGPGWHPIGPVGNLDPGVWRTLSAGRPLRVPGDGAETMHHVHADDVAQGFELAIAHPEAARGEDFHVVAPTALNVRGYAQIAAGWFGREAVLESATWDEFRAGTTEEHGRTAWEHLYRSHCLSIEKARTLLGYAPAYQPEAAVLESVRWLVAHGGLEVEGDLVA